MSLRKYALVLLLAIGACGCLHSDDDDDFRATPAQEPGGDETPGGGTAGSECDDFREGFKNVYFGDLHTHSSYSLDAYFFNAANDPRAAHRFAKGEVGGLPAKGSNDPYTPAREVQIDRPLDFNAVTDHAEFLGGFIYTCALTEQSQQFCDEQIGQGIRDNIREIAAGNTPFQQQLLQAAVTLSPTDTVAWTETKQINDEEYEPCNFTTLHAYEHTSNELSQMFHRNVIFKGPTGAMPLDVFGAVRPDSPANPQNGNKDWELFDHLQLVCKSVPGCDVLTIPHNANLSDGRMYLAAGADAGMIVLGDLTGVPLGRKVDSTSIYFPMSEADAELRRSLDRSFEMTQHKGSSECSAGVEGGYLDNDEGFDPACDFEVYKQVCRGLPDDPATCEEFCTGDPITDPNFCSHQNHPNNSVALCVNAGPDGASRPADDPGAGETVNCVNVLDYYRNAMAEGLKIRQAMGINPYKVNISAASDTHNGISGNVTERGFVGHGGILDDEPRELLGFWGCDNELEGEDPADPDNCSNRTFVDFARVLNPGGLTGVWAQENTRDDIWDAVHRGESFGTSGPRMRIRSIASWAPLPADICQQLASGADLIDTGVVSGARMGGDLPPPPEGATGPYIAVWTQQDPEGYPLQSLDIVKGFINESEEPKVHVYNSVAETSHPVARPSMADCSVEVGNHPESLCAVWSDPDFDADRDAFWYARVREVPSCRWSAWMCQVEKDVDCAQLDPANGMFPEDSGLRGYEGCCVISGEPGSFSGQNHFHTIEERAWASPIWYETK